MKQIILTQGWSVKVDDEDYEWLNSYCWRIQYNKNTRYARAHSPFNCTMHVAIYKKYNLYDPNYDIDHKDGDGLNDQKQNLQLLTVRENTTKGRMLITNTSGFRGVHLSGKKYRSMIRLNGEKVPIGTYNTPEEAARAYDKIAKIAFGSQCTLNFPEER